MAYRNGTYIAFHANGTSNPLESDIKYFNLIKAWTEKQDDDFTMINSHEKTSAVRDSSKRETLRSRLSERLRSSKHLLLIVGKTTKNDTDWVPFEIEYAIDVCGIPLIVTYTKEVHDGAIYNPNALRSYWPKSLCERIDKKLCNAIHIPFRKEPIKDAISQFNPNKPPIGGGLGCYGKDAYDIFGI